MPTAEQRLKLIEAARQAREDAAFLAFGIKRLAEEFELPESEVEAGVRADAEAMKRAGFDPKKEADLRERYARDGISWDELVAEAERTRAEFEASR